MTFNEMKEIAFSNIEKYKEECFAINDDLSDNPELSYAEYESSKKLVKYLEEKGYNVEFPYLGNNTSFKATSPNQTRKRKIAIMLEYDALPEIGHACGHCIIASTGLLAGLSVLDLEEALDANIHIIGTPDEEVSGYKTVMIDKGAFNDYDMTLMVHPYGENLVAPKVYALDSYKFEFKGSPAHGASAPWDGQNALNGIQLMFHGIDMMRQHVKPDVRVHGIILNGGAAANIVPENSSAEIYIRSLERKYLDKVISMVMDCAKGAAIATQTTYTVTPTADPMYDLKYNKTGEDVLRESFIELGLELGDELKPFGSTDAGNVSYVCPTFHPAISISKSNPTIHTREFAELTKSDEAHESIVNGSKVLALQIIKIFADDNKLQAMKEDFLS